MKKIIFLLLIVSSWNCKRAKNSKTNKTDVVMTKDSEKIPGIVLENMDSSIDPKSDFYNYVNGNWMKNTKIPEDRTRWGGFGVLRKKTDDDLLELLENAKINQSYLPGTDQFKAMKFFESILDTTSRTKLGIRPLNQVLQQIEAISSLEEMQTQLAKEIAISAPFFRLVAFPNLSNSAINAPYISTGTLGLPERDYYLEKDGKSKEIREKYKAHITTMLQFIGDSKTKAAQQAQIILDIETKLAAPRLNKVERRDTRNFNNPRSLAQLETLMPSVSWQKWIRDLGVSKSLDSVIVMEPKYMKDLEKVFKETPLEHLKSLVRWSTLHQAATSLSPEIEKENWNFYNKTLRGAIEQRSLNERALSVLNASIGEAIGKLYVDAKFPEEAKKKAENMIANVIKAFQLRIEKLEWMSDSTKHKAIKKLDKFTVKIGYPDRWEDYSKLDIQPSNTFFENTLEINRWALQKNLDEIGEPVDKTKWGMSPQTVNAYFNPLNNEIVFPAAILQPPFYNYTADDAVNYGGIGAVIGHEISHAFDDSGARFDAQGNLVNWWSDEDLSQFTKRGEALAEQYSQIEVLDSVYINGKFTLGENIGDLGGVLGAYDGLQLQLLEKGRPEDIDGFSPEQRFFMSWATVWRTKIRENALRTQIKTDPHAPGTVRAVQPLLNIQAFYDAFDIKEGDPMYLEPEKRVTIW